jgi:3-phosphoshikimate 1-carboxyvinyltransferase
MIARVRRCGPLRGELRVPGDKSISHRALMLGAVAEGVTTVRGLAPGADVRSTAGCLRALGVEIRDIAPGAVEIEGRGLGSLHAPEGPLDCGNSGTTMRLLAGLLAGEPVEATLEGDLSLMRRPMGRVAEPLRRMGAHIEPGPPLRVRGGPLRAMELETPVASAQVKSAVLLAGLHAEGWTRVREVAPSRDHTERMLEAMGAEVERRSGAAGVRGRAFLRPLAFDVPGDPSSAAFLLAAAALVEGSDVSVVDVCVNPTRTGFVQALRPEMEISGEHEFEPRARLRRRYEGVLPPFQIAGAAVPRAIDELPLLGVVAARAAGRSEVRDASELRVKESDRIAALCAGLRAMGARIEERPDGFVVDGPGALHGAELDAGQDHRLAMSFAVAGLVAEGETVIRGAEWADISWPGFWDALRALGADVETRP